MKIKTMKTENLGIHTPTLKELEEIAKKLEKEGYIWWLLDKSFDSLWEIEKEETCLFINREKHIFYGSKEDYEEDGFPIVSAKEFLSKGSRFKRFLFSK